jgi:hypothetical protein
MTGITLPKDVSIKTLKDLQQPQRETKPFEIKKGMQVNLYGNIYKVQVIKLNGDLKLKFKHYDAAQAAKWRRK